VAKARLVPLTEAQLLQRRLKAFHDSIVELKRGQLTPSLPQNDPDFPNDPVQGQLGMQANLPYYFADGAWHAMGGISELVSPDNSIEVTNPEGPTTDIVINQAGIQWWADEQTVPAAPSDGYYADFTVNPANGWGGGTILSTSVTGASATAPRFITSGITAITVVVELDADDPGMSAGKGLFFDLQIPAPVAIFPNDVTIFGQSTLDAAGNPYHYLTQSGVRYCFSGDGVKLNISTDDTIDHLVLWRVYMIQIVGNGS